MEQIISISDKWLVCDTGIINIVTKESISFDTLNILTRMPSLINNIKSRIDKYIYLRPSLVKINNRLSLYDDEFITNMYYVNIHTGIKWKCVSSARNTALMRIIKKPSNRIRTRRILTEATSNINDWEVYTSDIYNLYKKSHYKNKIGV